MEFRRQLVLGHSALLLVTLITAAVAAIASHGGDIGVRSRLGEGSTFWFTLPAAG